MKIYFSILFYFAINLLSAQTDIYPFLNGNEYYYTDKNFNRISNKTYEEIFPFINEMAIVKINGKFGVINQREELFIPAMYESVKILKYGGLEVELNQEKFLVDRNNNRLNPVAVCGTRGLIGWPYHLRICKEGKKYGVDNLYGPHIPPVYDSISLIEFSFILIVKNVDGKYGVFAPDSKLTLTYPVTLDSIKIIRELRGHILERLLIYKEGKIGAVSFRGQMIAYPKYSELYFEYLYAPYVILENGKKGYVINGIEYWRKLKTKQKTNEISDVDKPVPTVIQLWKWF